MTVLEAEVSLADLPTTWERDAGPFRLALLRRRWWRRRLLAEAPIGLWALPQRVGERVVSSWPAHFAGPLAAARAWELRAPLTGDAVAGGAFDFPPLWRPDTMDVSVTLTGA
jgi:hypothetical protein